MATIKECGDNLNKAIRTQIEAAEDVIASCKKLSRLLKLFSKKITEPSDKALKAAILLKKSALQMNLINN